MLEVFRELEETTVLLELNLLGITFPIPGMVENQHFQGGPMSVDCERVRESYRKALAAARRARTKTRPAGKKFIDFWIGRLEFGVGYFDSIEASRKAITLQSEGKQDEAADEMRRAVKISRSMLESYARVAQNQSDVGAIASLVEYIHRPLKKKAATMAAKRNSK